jgi:hypothetical protein
MARQAPSVRQITLSPSTKSQEIEKQKGADFGEIVRPAEVKFK